MSNIQNYISDELTHFVGKTKNNDDEKFELLIKIINEGVLKSPMLPEGIDLIYSIEASKPFSTNEMYNPSMVCFCDIPISDMEIHMKKYSKFGLSFQKNFLVNKGVNPVRYIAQDSTDEKRTYSDTYNIYMKIYNDFFESQLNRKDNTPEEFRDCQLVKFFIDRYELSYNKFYDSEKEQDDPDNYYMEREWRSLKNIQFTINDIHRIILPVNYINEFTRQIPEYCGHYTTL